MKKITLLILLFVAFTSNSYGQVIASENFDSALDWTVNHTVGASTNSGWTQVTTGTFPTCSPAAGAGMARFNSFTVPAGDSYDLTSLAIPFTGGAYRVSFKMYRDNGYPALGDIIDVYFNTTATSTGGTLLGSVNRAIGLAPIESANGWYSYTFLIPGNPNGDGYISLLATSVYGNNIFVDEIKVENVPTCDNPSALTSSNITSSSTTIAWTSPAVSPSNGYEYFYSSTNVTPTGSGIGSTVSGITTADLVGLSPATTYYFWVRSICSSSDVSAWSDSRSFTTACVSVSSFSENFDGVATSTFPTCWGKVGTIGSANLQTTNPSSAPNTLYMYGSGVMPVVKTIQVSNLGAGTNRLKFDMRANFTVGGVIEIGYLTDPNDSTTFIALGNVTASSLTYSQYVFAPAAGTYSEYLALRHTGAPANSVLIDNVTWETIPNCLEPTLLVVSSITSSTAMVSWTAPANAPVNGYEYFVSSSNTPPTATTVATGSVSAGITMADLSNLTSATLYYVWVRGICSGSDVSSWSISTSFNTVCLATTVPYTQDFESAIVPALPMCTSNENVGTGNNWITAANPGSGFSTNVLKYTYSTPSAANSWFYTQPITLTAGTSYSIGYKYGNNSATYIESLKVAYGTSANASSMTTTLADYPSVTGATLLSDLITFTPSTSGDYYFGFNAYSIADQYFLFVDDITVIATPLATQSFNSSSFSYYPNPVKNTLNLSYSENISDVSVYNLLGQQVIAKAVNANQSQIDMSHLTSGTYMVKVTSNNQVKTIKVIKE